MKLFGVQRLKWEEMGTKNEEEKLVVHYENFNGYTTIIWTSNFEYTVPNWKY